MSSVDYHYCVIVSWNDAARGREHSLRAHITETARERHARRAEREREKHFCTYEAQLHFHSSTDLPFPSGFTFPLHTAFVTRPRGWRARLKTRVNVTRKEDRKFSNRAGETESTAER